MRYWIRGGLKRGRFLYPTLFFCVNISVWKWGETFQQNAKIVGCLLSISGDV